MPGISPVYASIWGGSTPPNSHSLSAASLIRLTFFVVQSGKILALRFYRASTDGSNHFGFLVKRGPAGGRQLKRAVAFVQNPSGTGLVGWQTAYMRTLAIAANEWYDIVIEWGGAQTYYDWDGKLSSNRYTNGDFVVPQDMAADPFSLTKPNGAIATTLTFDPNGTLGGNMPGVDVLFVRD